MTKVVSAALIAAVLTGCATSTPPRPNVAAYPTRGQSPDQQARDNYECQSWARQQTAYDPATDTAKSAGVGLAVGAIAGAATGAAIGAATGNAGRGAAVGAVVGGVGGTAVGAGHGYTRNRDGYDRAFAACMQARGYSVAR
jgi:phage tail tape-measure protein